MCDIIMLLLAPSFISFSLIPFSRAGGLTFAPHYISTLAHDSSS